MEVPTLKLTLEIDPGSDPISGSLGDQRGTWPFSGWLEFAAALQAVLVPVSEKAVTAEHLQGG